MTFIGSYAHSGGRILLSMIFLMSGLMKLQNPDTFITAVAALNIPQAGAYALMLAEVVGGAMILVGYQTRNVAILLSCLYLASTAILNLAVATPMEIMEFLRSLGLAGGFMVLFAQGAGKLSLDNLAEHSASAAQAT
ncbi:MAG: DoxX family protein [Paracoccaceae bacterium]